MKEFNPFAGIAQFVGACILTALIVALLVGQLIMAKEWQDHMYIMLIMIGLSVMGCKLSWKEYKQDK